MKQLNNLDEYDMKKAIESYAKLEVRVKDDMFGIEMKLMKKMTISVISCLNSKISYINEIITNALDLMKDFDKHGDWIF